MRLNKTTIRQQAGVTMILSILIMAGLTLITLAIGTFAIQQLRASQAITLTEPAVGAAETAGEEGLWSIKRTGTLTDCSSGSDSKQLSGGNAYIVACKSYGAAVFNVKGGTPFAFYLYNPSNINGDIDLNDYPYSYIDLTYVSGSTDLFADLYHLDDLVNPFISTTVPHTATIPTHVVINQVPAGTEGRMKVVLNSAADMVVKVNTGKGMPTYPTIDATGCSAKTSLNTCNLNGTDVYSRRINITVPQ